jgi:hypothetical protein
MAIPDVLIFLDIAVVASVLQLHEHVMVCGIRINALYTGGRHPRLLSHSVAGRGAPAGFCPLE